MEQLWTIRLVAQGRGARNKQSILGLHQCQLPDGHSKGTCILQEKGQLTFVNNVIDKKM